MNNLKREESIVFREVMRVIPDVTKAGLSLLLFQSDCKNALGLFSQLVIYARTHYLQTCEQLCFILLCCVNNFYWE